MTSDAKIGVLLGLVFIFLIAFVINGLPGLCEDRNNNELTTNTVSLQDNPPGLAAKERKASHQVINQIEPTRKQHLGEIQTPSMGNEKVRFTALLPKNTSGAGQTSRAVEIKTIAAVMSEQIAAKKGETSRPESVKPALPRVYIVREDDNLSAIARRFYGSQQGNENIDRIFQANRNILKSTDEIYEGQKLIIPPPPA